MPIPVLTAGDCREWQSDGAGGFVCVVVVPSDGDPWTVDASALGQAFGAGLVLMGPIIAALIAGYSILRALRNRRG